MPRVLTRLGADVERALTDVNVPAYVIDKDGILVWLNPSARARRRRARETLHGRRRSVEPASREADVRPEDSWAPSPRPIPSVTFCARRHRGHGRGELGALLRDHQVIGVFGLVSRPPRRPSPIVSHPHLTPRQLEVLRMLAHGASTDQIAESLYITRETVRNHVRHILAQARSCTRGSRPSPGARVRRARCGLTRGVMASSGRATRTFAAGW